MLYLPPDLPALHHLRQEGCDVAAATSGLPPSGTIVVGLLNLMPHKAVTELHICRQLAAAPVPVLLRLLKFPGQTYKHTPQEYMDRFYQPVDSFLRRSGQEPSAPMRLIVTGAPLEQLPFPQVRYWSQLCALIDEAAVLRIPSLYICWGAQAALYHTHHISKRPLPSKQFGIYAQRVLEPHPLMHGLSPQFPMPVSRHTDVELPAVLPAGLRLLAASSESGAAVLVDDRHCATYITGHLEYAPLTLHEEYLRDRDRGLPIQLPANYYPHDDFSCLPQHTWCDAARIFYTNFILQT